MCRLCLILGAKNPIAVRNRWSERFSVESWITEDRVTMYEESKCGDVSFQSCRRYCSQAATRSEILVESDK